MDIVITGRQGGKTAQLVQRAARDWLYIVCVNQAEAHRIYREAFEREISIPYPITWHDFLHGSYGTAGIRGFLIDNLDLCIQSITAVPVTAVSLNGGEPGPRRQPAFLTALADCADEELRDALIVLGPEKRARLREALRADAPAAAG